MSRTRCTFLTEGHCSFGNKCPFRHYPQSKTSENVVKTPENPLKIQCKNFFTPNGCRYGNFCSFSHDLDNSKPKLEKVEKSSFFSDYQPTKEKAYSSEKVHHERVTIDQKHTRKPLGHDRQPFVPDYHKATTPIIDIGINLVHKRFQGDMKDVLKRAVDCNVTKMIITGTSVQDSVDARRLVEVHSDYDLFFTSGVHPHDAKWCSDDTIATLEKLASHKKCVAIGECGLDFDRMFSPKEVQEHWFGQQLALAEKLGKPVFLHERKSHDEFINILSKYKVKACVHCFTGTQEALESFLKMGYYIGITGWICDETRGTDLAKFVKLIPLNRLMIET